MVPTKYNDHDDDDDDVIACKITFMYRHHTRRYLRFTQYHTNKTKQKKKKSPSTTSPLGQTNETNMYIHDYTGITRQTHTQKKVSTFQNRYNH